MAREKLCPKCEADITDSLCEDDPDTGITGGYYCDACDEGYPYESDDETDYVDWDAMAEKRLGQS